MDSSLDWGQDLPGLRRWLANDLPTSMRDQPVYLSYFGTGSPPYYGLETKWLPGIPDATPQPHVVAPLEPGTYCISATMLQCVYAGHPGPWTERSEAAYQALAHEVARFETIQKVDPQILERMAATPEAAPELKKLKKVFDLYEHFRLDRLLAYLREREPDAEVGYSILIYYLDAKALDAALVGPLSAWPKNGAH